MPKPGKLTGPGLRFLRQEVGMSRAKHAAMLGNEAQSFALCEKRSSQPNIADCFILAIFRELNEGNAHIQGMIDRLIDADLAEGEGRMTLDQADNGWKVAAKGER